MDERLIKETRNLDITIAEFIIPRLELFKKVTDCQPNDLESMNEWYKILDKIIKAFSILSKKFDVNYNSDFMDNDAINEGLDLFRKYYRSLWW